MPVTKTTSVLAKLGNRLNKSITGHAKDETDYGIIRIPGGISGGIAQLVEARFGEFQKGNNKGKPFLFLMGVAKFPKSVNGSIVRGCQTSQTIPICETTTQAGEKTSEDENIETMMNHLRMLGGEEFTQNAKTIADVEELVKELKEAKPYFRFSTELGKTTPQYPTPRVWERWHGSKGLEDWTDEDGGPVDETAQTAESPAPSVNGSPPKKSPPTKATTVSASSGEGKKDLKASAKAAEESPADPEFNDVDSLAERADGGDEEAAADLAEAAANAGISDEDVAATKTFAELAELIKGNTGEATTERDEEVLEETEEIEQSGPSVGDEVSYRPLDKATKKPGKVVKCEIEEIDEENGTLTLKSKTKPPVRYKGVPVARIEA